MPYILSALFAILLVAGVVPIADQALRQGARAVRIHAVASQGHQIIEATDAYVKANYGALLTSTASGPQTIPLSALVTTGYLPPSTSAIDAYNQTWEISFYQPAAQDLEVLIHTTGGNPIPTLDLPEAAAEMGARGGLQPDATGPYVSDGGDAIGAYGGWKVPVSQFGIPANPGSPADLLYYNSGTLSSTYLYRVAVPGEPQVNTMQTNLNAGGNNVTNTGVVQFTTNPASGVIYQGEACAQNGAIGTNSNGSGQLMVCQGGSWGPPVTPKMTLVGVYNYFSPGTGYLMWANQCVVAGVYVGGHGSNTNNRIESIYAVAGPNAQGQYLWYEVNQSYIGVLADCYDVS